MSRFIWFFWAVILILQDFGQTAFGFLWALGGLLILAWPALRKRKVFSWSLLAYPLWLVATMPSFFGGRVDTHLERSCLVLTLILAVLALSEKPRPDLVKTLWLGLAAGSAITLLPLSWPISLDHFSVIRIGVASVSLRGVLWGVIFAASLVQFVSSRGWWRGSAIGLGLVAAFGIYQDGSTAAVLGLGLGGLVALLGFWSKIPKKYSWGLTSLGALGGFAVLFLRLREADPLGWERLRMWKMSLHFIQDHPVVGGGVHALERFHHGYDFPLHATLGRFSHVTRDPHSIFLSLLTESGITGLIVLILSLFVLFRLWRPNKTRKNLVLSLAGISVLIGLGLVTPLPGPVPGLLAVLLLSTARNDTDPESTAPKLCPENGLNRLVLLPLLLGGFWLAGIGILENILIQPNLDREQISIRHQLLWRLAPVRPNQARRAARFMLAKSEGDLIWWDQGLDWLDRAERHAPGEAATAIQRVGFDQALRVPPPSAGIHLASAISRAPFNAFLRRDQARLDYSWSNLESAKKNLEAALQLEPHFIQARLELAQVLLSQKSPSLSEARKHLILAEEDAIRFGNRTQGTPYETRLVRFDPEFFNQVRNQGKAFVLVD